MERASAPPFYLCHRAPTPTEPWMLFTPPPLRLQHHSPSPKHIWVEFKTSQIDSRPSSWGDGITVDEMADRQTDRQRQREWVCVCVCAHNLLSQSRKLGSSSKAIQWWKRVRDNAALSNVPHLLPAFTHPPTGFPTHTCKSTPPPPYTLSRGLSCKLDLVLEECGPGERQGKKTHFWTFSSKKTIVSERQTEAPANAREKNSTIAFTI